MMHETELDDFFENAPVALHIVRSDGIIMRANAAELDLLGYPVREYVGRHIKDFYVDHLVIDDILARLGKGEAIRNYPAQLRAKDGSIRHVEITSSSRFRDGQFLSTRCITIDRTAEMTAVENERRLEHKYRALLDALQVAIYVTDKDGKITYYNEAAVAFSGRRPELYSDSWCVTWRLFRLDGTPLPHDECPMAIALKENRTLVGEEAIAERPDGSRIHFAAHPTPIRDREGRLIGAINLLVDVTNVRAAERAASHLAAIVQSSNDAIVSKTLEGIVTSWNDAAVAMFGYKPDEIIGRPITTIIPSDRRQEEDFILGRLRRGERIEHFETVRRRKDGELIDVSLSISPIRDRNGRVDGASKIARDVTERKRAEATQRMLLEELSHRVKNTLATVQSIASQTLRTAASPAEFVGSFTSRLQALASAHSVLTATNWQGAELQHLIRGQAVLGAGSGESRIEISGPPVLLPAQLALHLALVFHELSTNARKHGALSVENGRVEVTWSLERTTAGIGIDLEWREAGGPPVAHCSASRQGFGTKLIERSVAYLDGGKAVMHRESNGIWWSISLRLPDGPATHAANTSTRAIEAGYGPASTIPGSRQPKRVLVVEDEPLLAMVIEEALTDGGFEVVGPVSSADAALQSVAQRDCDAALLDVNLNGNPVDDVASCLTRQNIPFVFVTGHGRQGLPRDFADARMLEKPFRLADVVKAAESLFN